LVAYEEAAKRANNPDGAWSSSSLLMSKWKQWDMDWVDLSMRIDSKETMINKPPSHLFTDAALPLHGSWVLSDFNY
jgi:hypothetical protein